MKINFKALACQPQRKGDKQHIDIAEHIGEAIYQKAKTRKEAKLADKIGDSTGEIELDEAEVAIVQAIANNFVYWLKSAIYEALGIKEEEG